MSNRWPAGIIRKTPVTPAGPLQNGAASGVWSLADAAYWTKQGLWPLAGNEQLVVEDVFSTWLYTGTGAAQTITNGIDLAGEGGLVWTKSRSSSIYRHTLVDTARGGNVYVSSSTTDANISGTWLTFNSDGYGITTTNNYWNANTATYASWTFRKAPNFFDVVTYTGTGANRTIAHNLGVAPGMILVKRTDTGTDWQVYHRSNANTQYMVLNTTAAKATGTTRWNSTTPTATDFTVGTEAQVNGSGGTYVAYLFAHDATSDGVIQCGSYTGTGAVGNSVTLGWEPQFLMIKRSSGLASWELFDNMRGLPVGSADAVLAANTNAAETSVEYVSPTATGFQLMSTSDPQVNQNGETYIYVAIRRGPMKTPTLGTSVFSAITNSDTTGAVQTTGFPVDLQLTSVRNNPIYAGFQWMDRSRGVSSNTTEFSQNIQSYGTFAEAQSTYALGWNNTGFRITSPNSGFLNIFYNFRRAPGFFDEVCYTGTGVARTVSHNLGVAPELMIVKRRNGAAVWPVCAPIASAGINTDIYLNQNTADVGSSSYWNNTAPTASVFSLGASNSLVNGNTATYVAYLFASCPGVSKVGSYTGTGALQTVDCAFTTGARFVLIKRTDSTGDWYVWDSARGISSGNDPYLLLNSTAAEVTGTNYVDTDTTGFKVTAAAPAGINANGGSYIFLAIA